MPKEVNTSLTGPLDGLYLEDMSRQLAIWEDQYFDWNCKHMGCDPSIDIPKGAPCESCHMTEH